jgi:tetratricopeptide (TPR) repeat protein
MRLIVVAALAASLLPAVVRADWLEASSQHFVIYADDRERDLRLFSEQLERFHSALSFVTGRSVPVPSPSNRVTVYVVTAREVRELYGEGSQYVRGFYRSMPGNSLAVVPRVGTGTTNLEFSMIVLLHEYSHHFMATASPVPMQRWYSEGAAEFFASAGFPRDGSVQLGRPAAHRALELFYGIDVRAGDLLDPEAYARKKRKSGYDAFYGKSWLLFHYLTFNEKRDGQLEAYLRLLGRGKSSPEAGREAFGDFDTLEKELDAYIRSRKMALLSLSPEQIPASPVTIRPLRAGEAAMMPVRVRSRRGVTRGQALALLPEARAVATRFPDDAAVLAALAEAEHDAGNDPEAIAAADAAITRDPAQVNAYVQKGLAMFRLAEADPDPPGAYARARAPFLALNRLENDHPLPLMFFYDSFVRAGQEATDNAVNGLERAVQLAPFDSRLRMTLAMEQIQRGQLPAARRSLAPVALSPHGGGLAEAAQRVMARIDADASWDGADLREILEGGAGQPEAE